MKPNASSPATVLVAVCGGIAAYKAVDLVSRLRKAGHEVHVVMSDAAREFVTPLTFAAISGQPVLASLFPRETQGAGEAAYPHLYPATRADAFVVAPATADMIARLAQGLGSDIVSTCALSLKPSCRRVFCPAMNVEMWRQPVVQDNVRALESRGWTRIGPESGALACGMEGEGRLTEPALIAEQVQQALSGARRLSGRRVLVISGPTREHLDPVRFIGNPSTGKMGRALAEEALAQGAEVDFVTGPVAREQVPAGEGLAVHPVVSADDMLKAARQCYGSADVILYAAAVADYRPKTRHAEKLPKTAGPLTLELEATPDVASTLNARRKKGQVTIGFALQTHDGLAKAREKLKRKQLDGIVLNALDALGGEDGTYTFIGAAGKPADWGRISKRTCASRILDEAARLLDAARG